VNAQAERIYGPIIERRGKAEKVRTTLNILERYKFFFSLPSGLLDSIKQVCDRFIFGIALLKRHLTGFINSSIMCRENTKRLLETIKRENTYIKISRAKMSATAMLRI
jgi:hypothetical protein